jgi:hypothetical protein
MIHYQLQCGSGHGFDGWFRDSAAFEAQVAQRLIVCPECCATDVARALMAPSVARGAPPPAPPPAQPPRKAVADEPMPDQVRALLQRLRAEVERNCDYVGPNFAEEARRMHNGESERRGIYGEASDAEAEALDADGVRVARIPWVPRADG